MIKIQTGKGAITVSGEVFTAIAGEAATNCFGVVGMAVRSMSDGLVHLLKREAMTRGVHISYNEDGSVDIELHIITDHGVNIPAICHSIISEVQYKVSKATGISVLNVHVFVDSMIL